MPDVGEAALRHLDESGIAELGAEVFPGDILVGKITPTTAGLESSSLHAPAGCSGVVRHVDIFTRRGVEESPRARAIKEAEAARLRDERDRRLAAMEAEAQSSEEALDELRYFYEEAIVNLERGNELPPGVIEIARIVVEEEPALSIGDTVADRHGMRCQVMEILAEPEMPRLRDGRALDALLPLHRASAGALAEARAGNHGSDRTDLLDAGGEVLSHDAPIGVLYVMKLA